jgi:hypothetical protein
MYDLNLSLRLTRIFPEKSVIFNQLAQLIAQEDFINLVLSRSINACFMLLIKFCIKSVEKGLLKDLIISFLYRPTVNKVKIKLLNFS